MPEPDHSSAGHRDPAGEWRGIASAMTRYALYIVALSTVFLFFGPLYLFRHQDFPALVLVAGFLLAAANRARALPGGFAGRWMPYGPALLIAAAFLIPAIGTGLVFGHYAFSRDEVMAEFDADILARGKLMARAVTGWIGYSDALIPLFRHPVPGDVAWVSN
ncbi:MAG: hypothetical protein ABW048_08045, partial [Sphingobium sp.]